MSKRFENKMVVPFEIKQYEVKKVKDIDLPVWLKQLGMDEELEVFEFKGYASTFGNIDHGDDVVMKGAFVDSLADIKQSGDPLPILWQHDMGQPLGVFIDLFEDEKGLFVHGLMPKDDEFVAKRVMPQMRVGSIRKMSIGFSIIDANDIKRDEVWIREIIKAKLWETSLVTIPMNSEADVTEIKSITNAADIESMSERELERAFRKGICFTRKQSKALVSIFKSDSVRDALAEDGRDADEEETKSEQRTELDVRLGTLADCFSNKGKSDLETRLASATQKLTGGQSNG